MEHLKTQILEVTRAMWRRRWIGVLVGWLVAVLGAIGLSMLPDRFEASARVYVDTKSVLRPLMRDLAVEPDLDQTVGLLARTLITRPNAEALLDKLTDTAVGLWEVFLGAVGEYVQVVAQGDDVGMQQSLFISPALYRKFIKPRQKRIFDFIHSRTHAKVFYHSCGSVYDVIPDFIEIGVDALNPIQRSAAKMDIASLKKEFGRELAFWGGGIDVQQVLTFASLREIEDEVNRTIDIMAPGGGYVFVPSHNIQPDVSADRLCRVYETALKRRSYPIGNSG